MLKYNGMAGFTASELSKNTTKSGDSDLARAIELSMKETGNNRPANHGSVGLVDLTEEDEEEAALNDDAVRAKRRKTDHDAGDCAASPDNSADKTLDLAEKRRLAAEAAMKRLEQRRS